MKKMSIPLVILFALAACVLYGIGAGLGGVLRNATGGYNDVWLIDVEVLGKVYKISTPLS